MAAPPAQGQHPQQGGEDVQVHRGEEEHEPPGAQHPHHQGDGEDQQVVVLLGDDALRHQPQLGKVQGLARQHGAGAPVDIGVPVVHRGRAGIVEGGRHVHHQYHRQDDGPPGQGHPAEGPGRPHQGQNGRGEEHPAARGAQKAEGGAPDGHVPHGEEGIAGVQRRAHNKGSRRQQPGFPRGAEGEQEPARHVQPPGRQQDGPRQQGGQGGYGQAGQAPVQQGPQPHQRQPGQADPGPSPGQQGEGPELDGLHQPGGQVMSRPART